MQYSPSDILKPFVKSYTLIAIDQDIADEVFYPSGYIDFVIKLSGSAATIVDGYLKNTPEVELLGHLTVPARLNAAKGTVMLIARFFPYACPLFFSNPISDFTNYATDLYGVFSDEIRDFYDQLMYCSSIEEKVRHLDGFLIRKLKANENRYRRTRLAAEVCRTISVGAQKFDISGLSHQFGLSERSTQKLFLEYVGINPAALYSVTRFNRALDLVLGSDLTLTSIAYDCGYYDQAHFNKDFKKFTGIKPLEARRALVKNGEEFQQAVNIGF